MLGKLIKHEFKNTYKVMLAVYVAYALLTIVGSASSYTLAKGYSEPNILTVSVIVFYVLSCVAVYVATFVYICIRYYKTMYSSQGYLTHTLPVKGVTVFNAKLIVSSIWMIVSVLLLLISVFFFANAASEGEFWNALVKYSWSDLGQMFYEELGINLAPFVAWTLFGCVAGMVLINLWIFTSFALGQLSDKHKVALSLVSGMVLYFLFQIVGLSEMAGSMHSITFRSADEINFSDFFNAAIVNTSLWTIVICAVMYGVCVYINKKKLNLE